MKWIAVILVMLNVAAYLAGLQLDPNAAQVASSAPFESVNEAAMSVIKPESRRRTAAVEAPKAQSAAPELVEDEITQLKIDNRGKVLTTSRNKPAQADPVKAVAKAEPSATKKPVSRAEPNPILRTRTAPQKEPLNLAPEPVAPMAVKPAPEPGPVVKPVVKPEPAPKPASKPKPAPEPRPVQAVVAQAAKVTPAPVVTRREPLACYRLGPFDDKTELTTVRRKLKSQSIDFKLEEKTLPGDVKGARVYVGGFSDAAAMAQEKQRLKGMKVDNYEVSLNGDSVLQLGYFKSANGASKAQKMLKAKGIDAKIYTIYNSTRIESWLTLIAAPREKVSSLTLPKGVRAKEQSCP